MPMLSDCTASSKEGKSFLQLQNACDNRFKFNRECNTVMLIHFGDWIRAFLNLSLRSEHNPFRHSIFWQFSHPRCLLLTRILPYTPIPGLGVGDFNFARTRLLCGGCPPWGGMVGTHVHVLTSTPELLPFNISAVFLRNIKFC